MNSKYIEQFLIYLKLERQLSENTCNSYEIDLRQFDQFINCTIDKMTKEQLNDYVIYLKSAYKENSYLRKIAALKSLNKYLRISQLPNNQYVDLLEVKKREKKLPKFLTQEQIDLLLNNLGGSTPAKVRDQAMFETLYATGMRVSEIINVKVSDVNLEEQTIRVLGKGNKERIVIINNSAKEALENYIDKYRLQLQVELTDYLFLNMKGRKLSRQGFNYILKNYAKEVGISDISPHIFRHSIATHMLNNGGDLRLIQMLLGHANITTTEVYTHVSKQKILEEYEQLHPLAKEKNGKI